MAKFVVRWMRREEMIVDADSPQQAINALRKTFFPSTDFDDEELKLLGAQPWPIPPPPPEKPKPGPRRNPRGGKPNGGGSPGTPTIKAPEFHEHKRANAA